MPQQKNIYRAVLVVFFVSLVIIVYLFFPKDPDVVNTKDLDVVTNGHIRGEPESKKLLTPVKVVESDYSAVNAESFLVFDKKTGIVILEKDPLKKLPIASLTKMVTALASLSTLDLRAEYEVKPNDELGIKPVLGLRRGDKVLLNDLVLAMLVGSANDAALTLGHAIEQETGRNIKDVMNEKASELFMNNSHFANPIGFDDFENYSTAYDISLLVSEALKHGLFEVIGRTEVVTIESSTGKKYSVRATNKLIKNNKDIEAIKTGNTPEASGSMVTQAEVNGNWVVIIVLKSNQRENDTLLLKDLVSKNFIWN